MIEEIETIHDLLEAEKFAEAESAIKEALLKYPDSPDILVLQSEVPLRVGKLEIAEKILLDILSHFPNHLYKFLPPFFCQGGNGKPDNLTIVRGH